MPIGRWLASDLTIAVASQEEVEGYSSWSVNEASCTPKPPVRVLQEMHRVRFHLDSADETNEPCGCRQLHIVQVACPPVKRSEWPGAMASICVWWGR